MTFLFPLNMNPFPPIAGTTTGHAFFPEILFELLHHFDTLVCRRSFVFFFESPDRRTSSPSLED